MSTDQTPKIEAPEQESKIISTGWRLKDLTAEQLQAAPDDVFEIYMQTKAGQTVDPEQLMTAIKNFGGKYFIGPKARYAKKSKKSPGPIAQKVQQAFRSR